ncbi:MAG: hypothetical protein ABI832_15295 [bacterium]
MEAMHFKTVCDSLAKKLTNWARQSLTIEKGENVRLHGIDRSNTLTGLSDLFFKDSVSGFCPTHGQRLKFLNQETLDSSTLRNTFFPQIFASHSKATEMNLKVEFQGSFLLKILVTDPDEKVSVITEVSVASAGRSIQRFALGALSELANGSRLSWIVRADDDDAELFDISWETVAPRTASGRMAVVIRTYGRTPDVLKLLRSFESQSGHGDHGRILRNIFFLIYDSSAELTGDEYDCIADLSKINAFVFSGPNLGGGGNMSLELLGLSKAISAANIEIDELLLLDDDLAVSLESIIRNWSLSLFRTDHSFHSSPVLMKSRPRRLWEDGAFWGRFIGGKSDNTRTFPVPRLVGHNREFRGAENLYEMARLNEVEYCTFIFLSMPYCRLVELGLPVAFFLRGDDVELCLRHVSMEGNVVSNPNLSVWHEPFHSYSQEYMSIAHGTIINLVYGSADLESLVEFFHGIALSHLSISDYVGLSIYGDVLRDLISHDRFLVPGFSNHYADLIARYRKHDAAFSLLPTELLDSVKAEATRVGEAAYFGNFLHLTKEPLPRNLTKVVLRNPHTERSCLYDAKDPARLTKLAAVAGSYYSALANFCETLEDQRSFYAKRLAATKCPEFWINEVGCMNGFEVLHG